MVRRAKAEGKAGFWEGDLFAFLLFFGVALLVYYPLLRGGLENDDYGWCLNAQFHGLLSNDHNPVVGAHFWRPFLSVVFGLLWKIFGTNPIAFRVFNLLLAATTAYALRAIWLRLAPEPSKDKFIVLAMGLAFILWPSHPETFAWIAGMTDGLSIALATLGIWTYIVYRQSGQSLYLILTLLLMALGLLSKEAALVFPLICFGIVAVLLPWKKSEVKIATLNLLLMLGLIGAFILVREHVIGRLVGGYNDTGSLRRFTDALLGNRFSVNVAHGYIPFDQWLALAQGSLIVKESAIALVAGMAALLLRTFPRSTPIPETCKRLLYLIALLWFLAWVPACLNVEYLFVLTAFESVGRLSWVAAALMLGLLYLCLVRGERWRSTKMRLKRLEGLFDPETHPLTMPVLLGFLTYTYLISGSVTPPNVYLMILCYLAVVYVTRPARLEAENPGFQRRYAQLGLTALVASFLALAPPLVAGLPVTLQGEWLRFCYATTVFSMIAIFAFFRVFVRDVKTQVPLVAIGLLALLPMLYPNWEAWRETGELSNQTAELIKKISPARRIYILAAPETVSGAGLYGTGLPLIAAAVNHNPQEQIIGLYQVLNFLSPDKIVVKKVDDSDYEVSLEAGTSKRLSPITSIYFPGALAYYSLPETGHDIVHIKNFDPAQDRVIIVDSKKAVRVD